MTNREPDLYATKKTLPRAILIGIVTPAVNEFQNNESLAELSRLVTTLGLDVVGQMSQRRPSTNGGMVLGDGKLQELARMTGGTGKVGSRANRPKTRVELRQQKEAEMLEALEESGVAQDDVDSDEFEDLVTGDSATELTNVDTVVFDCELTPSQLSNLQRALGVEVLDRTGVIVEIFSRHARTRESRIQVEIARLNYLAPRIRLTGDSGDRGGGGGTGGRGAGETTLELDRRRIRDRIAECRADLLQVQAENQTRRDRRTDQNTVALVGYTNAGKSSLMRALTGSAVLVADKLFATLDTTVRALHPETQPRILVSDTVGFIKRLPHDLVASFKSTLEEARNASLLLFVVDASDPSFRSQLEVTKQVLAEIKVDDIASTLVLNKSDKLTEQQRSDLAVEYPEAQFLSSIDPADVTKMHGFLVSFFEQGFTDCELLLPYDRPALVGEVRRHLRVTSESYTDDGVTLCVRAPQETLDLFRKKYGI